MHLINEQEVVHFSFFFKYLPEDMCGEKSVHFLSCGKASQLADCGDPRSMGETIDTGMDSFAPLL